MREFSVPPIVEVGPDEAIPDMLASNVAEHGGEVGLRRQVDGQWTDVTWREFGEQVGKRLVVAHFVGRWNAELAHAGVLSSPSVRGTVARGPGTGTSAQI